MGGISPDRKRRPAAGCCRSPRSSSPGAVVRLLTGTVEAAARLRLLDCDRLEPGSSAMVQLFTEAPLAVPTGEPFIIRTPSPPATIGGGRILDPASRRRRRHDAATLEFLWVLAKAGPMEILAHRLRMAGSEGCRMADLARLLAVSPERLRITASIRPNLGCHGTGWGGTRVR
jgi:selenocysteine-specific elongation factor